MRIEHISFSKSGGAGRVADQLVRAQVSQGLDAKFLYLIDEDLRQEPLRLPSRTVAAAVDEFIVSNHSEPTPISMLRSQLSSLARFDILNGSLVHLHWIEGVLTPKDVFRLANVGKPLVWTLHDMRPFTGACHHSLDCQGFESDCSDCPQVREAFRGHVKLNLQKRADFFLAADSIQIVAPSEWLATRARKSTAFQGNQISVVNNPISDDFFEIVDKSASRRSLGINDDVFVGLSIAEQLSSPGKQIAKSLETFFAITKSRNINAKYLLIGGEFDTFTNRYPDVVALGTLSSKEVSRYAAAADVYINMSVAESFGLTTVEAMARDVFPIVRNVGGMVETVSAFGFGAVCDSFADLGEAIWQRLNAAFLSTQLRRSVSDLIRERHSSSSVSRQYLDIYQKTIRN